MKRSEMVTYLYKLINTYEDIDETAADEILEGIEHMGMLPPLIPIHRSSRDLREIQPTHVFEWEPES